MQPLHINATINPYATSQGTRLNNLALQAEQSGDLVRAENLHLEALAIKEMGLGPNSLSTAISQNALGELYITLGRLDDAETYLRKAIAIRNHAGPAFDAAVSRENLAQLYELRGDLKQAKEIRLYGAPDHLSCGYYHVNIFSSLQLCRLIRLFCGQCTGQIFSLSQLSQCGQCKVRLCYAQ